MKRKRLVIIIFSFLAAMILGALLWPREREPEYQGESLTFWLIKLTKARGTNAEAENAIRHIGTNALPLLTKWLGDDIGPPERKTLEIIDRFPQKLQRPLARLVLGEPARLGRTRLSIQGFKVLGPQAQGVVPELVNTRIIRGKRDLDLSLAQALRAIGTNSLPALVTVLTNETYTDRIRTRAADSIMFADLVNSYAASNLALCVQSGKGEVAYYSANILSNSKIRPDVVVPFSEKLATNANSTKRIDACSFIGRYGSVVRSALPTLTPLLADPLLQVRVSATNAVYEIDSSILPPGTRPPAKFE